VATVTLFNPDGTTRFAVRPFGSTYSTGVKVATGDVTGDGVEDVVVATAGDIAAKVRVIDGATGKLRTGSVFSTSAYTGAVEVAVGDVTGDGIDDIAVVTNEGSPRARVYRGGDFTRLVDFRPVSGSGGYLGRPQVALADLNADGRDDLVVAGRYSAGMTVAGYSGATLGSGAKPARVFQQFVLTGTGFAEGAYLAAGDLSGDGHADLVFGARWGAARVLALSGRELVQTGARTALADFAPVGSGYANGVRVGVSDLDGDGRADLLTGSGPESGNRMTAYLAKDLTPTGAPLALDLTVYAGYTGGLYVG
jgi:hypothetical protein